MPFDPPVTGVRIRQQPGFDNGDGTNDARAWYYDRNPAVRAVVGPFLIEGTTDFSNYGRDPAQIIDRWCLAPGVAPYTERQVRHSGPFTAEVTYTNVDNAPACQVTCTLGVTLTSTPVVDGRATVTATATGAQGGVLFSLDGFDTPGLSPLTPGTYAWADLRTGAYTVTVRETRAGGCVATASLTLTASYGLRYALHAVSEDETPYVARIFERDYTGAVTEVTGQRDAVAVDYPGGATDHLFGTLLRGSECTLSLLQTVADEFRTLFSGDERLHRLEYERDGALLWKGFLLPEQYDAVFLSPPSEIAFAATDGLGTLSTIPFAGPAGQSLRGDWTLLQTLQYCLAKLELALPLRARLNLFPSTAGQGATALEQIRVDVGQYRTDKGKAWDCGKVVAELLKSFQCRLYQWAGAWWLERLMELTAAPMVYAVFSPAGVRGADLTVNQLHTIAPDSPLCWLTGAQRQLVQGAVATVTAAADPGEMSNLIGFALPTNADLPAAVPTSWASSSPTASFSQLLYQGKDKTPALRLVGTSGTFATSAARQDAALLAPWVQTPLTPPLPLPFNKGGGHDRESFVLRLTIKPYGVTPAGTLSDLSAFFFALRYGANWLQQAAGSPDERATPVIMLGVELEDDKEIEIAFRGFRSAQVGNQPVQLRFYAPVGGASAATVDVTGIRLEYDDFAPDVADYVETYTTATGQLVSRVDTADLFHTDTPHARYAGSLLDAGGLPTQGWYEPATPGQVRELGDWFVTGRNLLQRAPAQVLTGQLLGNMGPGALLTDPSEGTPAVYGLTSCAHSAAAATWQVRAVQHLQVVAPPEELPDYAIYNEDATAWLSEDGRVLIYEHA